MMFFTHNYRVGARTALGIAGYKHRKEKDDYIFEEQGGRFHAKIVSSKVIEFHYDLYVDWRHWSPRLPQKHHDERKRIMKALRHQKMREMKDGEIKKLLAKY